MMTREQILEIDRYCQEHGISLQSYFDEHGIARHQYFIWKRKYRQQDEQSPNPGAFVQLRPGGAFIPSKMPPVNPPGKAKAVSENPESCLTVDIRTASGTAMRIQGSMTAAHLREIMSVK